MVKQLTTNTLEYTQMDNTTKKKDRNFVHKHMEEFNKPRTHRDKKNDYKRKPKHKETRED